MVAIPVGWTPQRYLVCPDTRPTPASAIRGGGSGAAEPTLARLDHESGSAWGLPRLADSGQEYPQHRLLATQADRVRRLAAGAVRSRALAHIIRCVLHNGMRLGALVVALETIAGRGVRLFSLKGTFQVSKTG